LTESRLYQLNAEGGFVLSAAFLHVTYIVISLL
jgi:hypothetical protein